MSVFLQGPLADVQTGCNIPVCQIHLAVQREMTAFISLAFKELTGQIREIAAYVRKYGTAIREENKEATNNVKADVTSKGLRIKDPCQQVRIY